MSIAGGLHRAIDRAGGYGFDCCAMFVRNQVQWKAPRLDGRAVELFREARERVGIAPVVAHASYLVNLAGRYAVRRKSITALREDFRRCCRLGVEYLVFHPGSREDQRRGIEMISEALNAVADGASDEAATILLETTAGQGNSVGRSFEQLAEILGGLDRRGLFGVCLDTCHVFAAGYDLRSPREYRRTMAAFARTVGMDALKAVHVNDSKTPLGSHVDRHAHIGAGQIGLAGLANLVNDRRLAKVPMILETPKGLDERGRDWDSLNAETLRGLAS